jgi:hypothetical protein
MMIYMCMCISLTNVTACKYDIPIDTVSTQSTLIRELKVYPAESPMPRASEAPFAPDIVRCLKSWTTVDAGRCSPCSPTNSHQDEDALLSREHSPGRRCLRRGRAVAKSLPKNLIAAHPVQGSQANEASKGTCSPVAPCAQRYETGKTKERLICVLSEVKENLGLTEDFYLYACGGEGENQPRNSRDGDTKKR